MRKTFPVLVFAILILFFIQSAGTLVESIYILDLMHTTLDARVLGLFFFFAPLVLLPFLRKFPAELAWCCFAVLLVGRSLLPWLDTAQRMLASGFATTAALGLFFLLLKAQPRSEGASHTGWVASAGLALAVGLSALLRTLEHGLDYSLVALGGWSGILLGIILGLLLAQMDLAARPVEKGKPAGVTSAVLGIFLVLTLVWFAFSSPGVIARWTEGSYPFIVAVVSLLAAAWVLLVLLRPGFFQRIGRPLLLAWNLAFAACLTATILVHGVPFPPRPDSPAVIVGAPVWWQAIPLVLMLLLFPVLFLDLGLFVRRITDAAPAPGQLVPGLLLGGLALILLVFFNIFSNVWGYVQPVSLFFRGKYWLAFFLPAAGLCLLAWLAGKARVETETDSPAGLPPVGGLHWGWGLLVGLVCLGTLVSVRPVRGVVADISGKTSLLVMTANIQGANDAAGEKSFERQLALFRKVSPDILALQETDTARISFNNNDYVRYYADSLGYYSYYGPVTVTGTYGTAILSKFPLLDTQSAFTFSDTDEIGVAEAQVVVNGLRFFIYDVHPDGSETAKLAFARSLLQRSAGKPGVIALGDYNLRDYEAAYQMINDVYTNAWTSVYPSKIGGGVDMSGENRIDHIFLSHDLRARNPVYLLPPASATDHPVHWAEVVWGNP